MRIFSQKGSKERLFDMMKKVNKLPIEKKEEKPVKKLNEEVLPINEKNKIINIFIDFVKEKLELGDDNPRIIISYDNKEAQEMKSFGKNTPEANEIRVVAINRNLADVLRTLGHELVHTKQYKEGKLKSDSGEDGSEFENEANSKAGLIMREFGKKYPEIFE